MGVPRIGRPPHPAPADVDEANRSTAPAFRRKSKPPRPKPPATVESPGGHNRRPRTGLRALKSRLFLRGLAVVDQRTAAAKSYIATRRNLLDDLGGAAACSESQMQLVDMVARGLLYLSHVDALLLERQSILNRRRSKLLPLVGERMRMSEVLARQLQALGLERRAKSTPSLAQWLEHRQGQQPAPEPAP